YYDRFPAVLEGYSDASWITGSSDSKSITGWIFTLGSGAVCWGSKKQTCITHSTMEAKFLALAAAGGCLDGLASSENVRGYCICKEIIQDVDMTRTDLKSVSFMRSVQGSFTK
ncbi:hypothetical protein Tco_1077993, partial [Tanacetum coccineum]